MNEDKPATVDGLETGRPKQAGETPARWAWVERSVWTGRMLERLDQSQEQTVWFSLWDKVWAEDNLHQACLEVVLNKGSAGVDGQSTTALSQGWREDFPKLQQQLREGSYQPLAARRVWIPKPGTDEKRPLGIPAVRDRVVQAALKHVMEPIFERDFAAQSYGFRPGKRAQDALKRVEELLRQGRQWVVDADLKSYFDTIPQDKLMGLLRRRIQDGRVLGLVEQFLKAGVMDQGRWSASDSGTPQGGVISPLLANIYLDPLDHLMEQRGWQMVRYADDFVVMCRTEEEARVTLGEIAQWVKEAGLILHPTKTRIVHAAGRGGFDFLGYHFERYGDGVGRKWPRQKSVARLRETLRPRLRRMQDGSMEEIIARINPVLRGWWAYFKDSLPCALESIDGWVRMRLRSIQRRRDKRPGMAYGPDHQRYPNRWFAERSLFTLARGTA